MVERFRNSNLYLMLRVAFGLQLDSQEPEPQQVKIISAALAKSGTKSIKAALEMLGYRVYHGEDCASDDHVIAAQALMHKDGAFEEWMQSVQSRGYNATLDVPMAFFYEEMMQMYPDAKVLLATRSNSTTWAESFIEQSQAFSPITGYPFYWLIPTWGDLVGPFSGGLQREMGCKFEQVWWNSTMFPWIRAVWDYKIDASECARGIDAYVSKVREVVPKDRLIEMSVKDGWKPLCEGLGLPEPDVPFPRLNSRAEIVIGRNLLRGIAVAWPFLGILNLFLGFLLIRAVVRCLTGRTGHPKRKLE